MHPATMEWLILQAALKSLSAPLAKKSMSFEQLSDALAPDFHSAIVALHLNKMQARGLLQVKQDENRGTDQSAGEPPINSIEFLAKIDTLLD